MTEFITLSNGAIIHPSLIASIIPNKEGITISMMPGCGIIPFIHLSSEQIPLEVARISAAMKENLQPPKINLDLDPEVIGNAVYRALRDALEVKERGWSQLGNKIAESVGNAVKESFSKALRIPEVSTLGNPPTLGSSIVETMGNAVRRAFGKSY